MLVFRQLFDPPSSTYTYVLADDRSGAAVIIDPVFEQVRRDAALIEELGLRLEYALETHVHADHVTGAWLLRQRTGCRIALSANGGAEGADRYLVQDDVVAFGSRNLQVRETPGHTSGCLTYVLDDRSMAFTGDCLFIRGTGRTDFQGGDRASCTAQCTGRFLPCRIPVCSTPPTIIAGSPLPACKKNGVSIHGWAPKWAKGILPAI